MTKYEKLSDLFKMFGDTTRVKILSVLSSGSLSAGDIAQKLEMSPSAVSHQLNTLKTRKLISSKREGKNIVYSLEDEHVYQIISCGIEHICED